LHLRPPQASSVGPDPGVARHDGHERDADAVPTARRLPRIAVCSPPEFARAGSSPLRHTKSLTRRGA